MANEGEKKAGSKLKEINGMIDSDEKYSSVENEIIRFFKENCQLYFNRFTEDVEYLRQHRTIRQADSARDFSSSQGLKSEGILYVFRTFQTAELAEKIR